MKYKSAEKHGQAVGTISDVERRAERTAGIESAAAELADRMKGLADTLARRDKPRRIRYGTGRLHNSFRRHTPEGFVVDPVNLELLLPDGRLWTYSRSDATRFPAGRYYDARTDYAQFAGNRTFPAGREFVFLGAVLGRYTFGFSAGQGEDGQADSPGLWAICGEGGSVRYVTADEAFASLAESTPARITGVSA